MITTWIIAIGKKNLEKWVSLNPNEIISDPEFWKRLQNDSETCLDESKYENTCWYIETELTSEEI